MSWRKGLYVIGIALGSSLFAYQILLAYKTILQSSVQISFPLALITAWGLTIIAIGLQMMIWARLMGGLGGQLSWRQTVKGYTLSFLPRYIPGSIWGYLSRSEWLYQNHQIDYAISYVGSLLEALALIIAGGLVIGSYYASISPGLTRAILISGVLSSPLLSWLIIKKGIKDMARWPLIKKMPIEQVSLRISFEEWLVILLFCSMLWSCYGVSILLILRALNISSSVGDILTSSAVFSIAWLTGFLALLLPAGLGLRELTLSKLMVIYLGLLEGPAALVSIISRLLMAGGELFWLAINLTLK